MHFDESFFFKSTLVYFYISNTKISVEISGVTASPDVDHVIWRQSRNRV